MRMSLYISKLLLETDIPGVMNWTNRACRDDDIEPEEFEQICETAHTHMCTLDEHDAETGEFQR